ncbi:hypothetical protein WH47_03320 [Habropoda laboriosa]|uniref:Uncharacterized protein n=1 Tax=Habropoda laboriosa TaxID=597456 RepID=A0A0L7RB65_9HYME|nr:hypothetical protein WH47_03320 [Habropoda laboriosa]
MVGIRQEEGRQGEGELREARGSVYRVGAGKQTTNTTTIAYETSRRQRITKLCLKYV